MEFKHPEKYNGELILSRDFEQPGDTGNVNESGNRFYQMDEHQEFLNILENPYEQFSSDDHFWIKATADVRFPKGAEGTAPCLVMSMDRQEGQYGYAANAISPDTLPDHWQKVEMLYLTPEIRSHKDRFKFIVWKRGPGHFDIDNIRIEVFRIKH